MLTWNYFQKFYELPASPLGFPNTPQHLGSVQASSIASRPEDLGRLWQIPPGWIWVRWFPHYLLVNLSWGLFPPINCEGPRLSSLMMIFTKMGGKTTKLFISVYVSPFRDVSRWLLVLCIPFEQHTRFPPHMKSCSQSQDDCIQRTLFIVSYWIDSLMMGVISAL